MQQNKHAELKRIASKYGQPLRGLVLTALDDLERANNQRLALLDMMRTLANATDTQMADGDLAREIAAKALAPCFGDDL